MTYKEIVLELKEIGFDVVFENEMKNKFSDSFIKRLNEVDKIHSAASLIRTLISEFEIYTENWEYWRKVLLYFIAPKFVRNKEMLPKLTTGA